MEHIFLLWDLNLPYLCVYTRFQKQTHRISTVKNKQDLYLYFFFFWQYDLVMLFGLLNLFLNIKLWV